MKPIIISSKTNKFSLNLIQFCQKQRYSQPFQNLLTTAVNRLVKHKLNEHLLSQSAQLKKLPIIESKIRIKSQQSPKKQERKTSRSVLNSSFYESNAEKLLIINEKKLKLKQQIKKQTQLSLLKTRKHSMPVTYQQSHRPHKINREDSLSFHHNKKSQNQSRYQSAFVSPKFSQKIQRTIINPIVQSKIRKLKLLKLSKHYIKQTKNEKQLEFPYRKGHQPVSEWQPWQTGYSKQDIILQET